MIYDQPYLSVNGGDVSAGNSFYTLPSIQAGVFSWNSGPVNYSGAGDQFAVYALGDIVGFATSLGNMAQAPAGLSFGNTDGYVNTGSEPTINYGGEFGSLPPATDYFSYHPATANTNDSLNISSLVSNQPVYFNPAGGTLTIEPDATIGNGTHLTVFVNGNVYIDAPGITFANEGPWGSAAAIPSFNLIAEGNIYINSSVSKLDGNYIAQPVPNSSPVQGGIINDCYSNSTTQAGAVQCALTVNGSFTAYGIQLDRNFGTLGNKQPAEIFNYGPQSWLSGPITTSPEPFNDVTNSPPVL
jgi:hypothetical protein